MHCRTESPQKTLQAAVDSIRHRRRGAEADQLFAPTFGQSVAAVARVENVTNTRYQEVLGTTGRALYGGFNATW